MAATANEACEFSLKDGVTEGGLTHIVGIGASAGGLPMLIDLVNGISLEHLALVIVQHLSPTHESLLVPLLARNAHIQVETARDGLRVVRERVYVIPPNAELTIADGVLHVSQGRGAPPRRPIDHFFQSLAADRGDSAVGVILSGTGVDGTEGLRAIRAAGGTTLVQEPSSAAYDGMPRNALEAGTADLCLMPDELIAELLRIGAGAGTAHPRPAVLASDAAEAVEPAAPFATLLELIRARFRNDLTQYKRATIERRIARRMALSKLAELSEYVAYVSANEAELDALYGDILISVTSFFRDGLPFEVLQTSFFPRLLETSDSETPMRVWVPACATGEEAYSIAIILCELFDAAPSGRSVQIFATDADPKCIAAARRGSYARDLTAEVSAERLARFFAKRGDAYQVGRRVREMVVFAVHDLLRQPPFSRIDLISCRNLLIYLQPAAQRRALCSLHYALKPGGGLLLGSSETVGDAPDKFELVHRKAKLYERRSVSSRPCLPRHADLLSNDLIHPPIIRPAPRLPLNLETLVDHAINKLYGPPGVVIDRSLEVLYFRGQTAPFLSPASGAASLHLLRLLAVELHLELKRCIDEAFARKQRVIGQAAYREVDEHVIVRMDCIPLEDADEDTPLLLVLFERKVLAHLTADEAPPVGAAESAQAEVLLRELESLRKYVQVVLDEKNASTEELQSANEELQSANEELQSSNEELETSKEELQSTNEELTTLNEELEIRMNELGVANDDLQNVLSGIDNAVLILDFDLRIRRYTASAEKLLRLVPSDVGGGISRLEAFCRDIGVAEKAASVIGRLTPVEEDVHCANQRWYMLRMVPYRTAEHAIRGVVVSLQDIDVKKRASELARDIGDYATRFLLSIEHPLLIVDAKLRVVWANDRFYEGFQLVREETVGSLLYDIGGFAANDSGIRQLVLSALDGKAFRRHEVSAQRNGSPRKLTISGNCIPVAAETPLALLSIEVERESTERDVP